MTSSIHGDDEALLAEADNFASDLTGTVSAIAPGCSPFSAQARSGRDSARVFVRQEPDTGVPLIVGGEPLLTLTVHFWCSWDRPGKYLAVDSSAIKVFAGREAQAEPLFRYEYERWPGREQPGAHVQVHGHRDGVSYVMTRAGRGSRRGRARADSDAVPAMRELHFPVGGPRFRPCLEDVLEMLVVEFGVDCSIEGREALQRGRVKWRGFQLSTAVRDNPEIAAETLRELGYSVTWGGEQSPPAGSPHKVAQH